MKSGILQGLRALGFRGFSSSFFQGFCGDLQWLLRHLRGLGALGNFCLRWFGVSGFWVVCAAQGV